MPGTEALASLIRRLAEHSRLQTPLEETIRAMTMSPSGQVLPGAMPTPQQLEALRSAQPMLRRKVLSDLTGKDPKLLTVHDTRKSGAGALNRGRSTKPEDRDSYIRARERLEKGLYGDTGEHPLYGYLSMDPMAEARGRLELRYPDSGTEIRPELETAQYGRYGVVPRGHVLDRSTLTFGDSLDSINGANPGTTDILDSSQYGRLGDGPYALNRSGSRMEALGRDYNRRYDDAAQRIWNEPYDKRSEFSSDRVGPGRFSWKDAWGETLGDKDKPWEHLGYAKEDFWEDMRKRGGMPNFGDELKAAGMGYTPSNMFPAMVPRHYRDPTGGGQLPFTPRETGALSRLGAPGGGYTELQVHGGMTPDDVEAVYDFGTDPSTAMEKKLRKLGIDYRPVVDPNNDLSRLRKLGSEADRTEFLRRISNEDPEIQDRVKDITRQLEGHKTSDVPKFWDHYAGGGRVGQR